VRDAAGQIHRLAVVSRDVTELRNLEDRLRQTQKMEAIGRLAAGVAHDFNNVLSVILSYSSLILSEPTLDANTREGVLEIHESGERAAELTRQLLTISRQQVLSPRQLEVGHVLESMRKMLQRMVGEDVQVTIMSRAEPSYVHADQGQLEQVVMNLVVNARDAMPNGGKVTIEVSKQHLDEGYAASHPGVLVGDYVQLAVSDTGVGMDAEVQERIFEPFFTTKEIGKGTGLGLSTVFGIVRQSGGHIYVYSELGLGTTFKVFLPLRSEVAGHSTSVPARPSMSMGSETILVVEDDPQVRQVLDRVLRLNGYRVLLAENGPRALELSEAHAGVIDLCVTDIVMTGMSGPALAQRLTRERPHLPILFLSGYAQHAAIDNGFLASGVPFLQKPTTPESLLSKVREVLGGGLGS
jgi:nitrogen-specific signal transduction histidine kinase